MSREEITDAITETEMTHREVASMLTASLCRPINHAMVTSWKSGSQPVPDDITPEMFQ